MNSANEPSPYALQSYISDETLVPDDYDSSGAPSSPQMKPREIKFDKYALPEQPRPPKLSKLPISFDQTLPPIRHAYAGDGQLIDSMDDGRHPEISMRAKYQPLPPIDNEDDCDGRRWFGHPRATPDPDRRGGASNGDKILGQSQSLRSMAESVLQKTVPTSPGVRIQDLEPASANDISDSTSNLTIHDKRPWGGAEISERAPEHRDMNSEEKHPRAGLPPIVSPDAGPNDRTLPSLRSITAFRDMDHAASEQDTGARSGNRTDYPHSPPLGPPHLLPLSASHGSPPISPPDSYQKSLPSPQSLPGSSPYYTGTRPHLITPEYGPTPTGPEAKNNELGRAPLTLVERVYPNGGFGNNAQPALYPCEFQGCKAPPFQTQYLLNSHANVHSQARPHYCPVRGCSRSEGGKGFKRKNEMIRHGLVHESPGYICPFCPEKDHRYPRPDNLQRYAPIFALQTRLG